MAKVTKTGREFYQYAMSYAGAISDDYRALEIFSLLARYARTLNNLNVVRCNHSPRWLTDDVEMRLRRSYGHDYVDDIRHRAVAVAERHEKVVEARVSGLVIELCGLAENISGIEFNGDPRGPAFRLQTRDGRGNSFVGGICSPV